MTPEDLVERLKQACPAGLEAVILYGSAASGDHVGKRSDYNVLAVTKQLGMRELRALAPATAEWVRAGNPPPLLFTRDRLGKSADTFPIELLDIRDSRRVLFGEDVVSGLEVGADNLRLELEHELKGKLIRLRERYLLTGGRARRVAELMAQSLSTFLVLFRAALRLFRDQVPAHKLDALRELAAELSFDPGVFLEVDALRRRSGRIRKAEMDGLFERYLTAVEGVVDAVDNYIRKETA